MFKIKEISTRSYRVLIFYYSDTVNNRLNRRLIYHNGYTDNKTRVESRLNAKTTAELVHQFIYGPHEKGQVRIHPGRQENVII